VLVRIEPELQIVIPCWMLDDAYCQALVLKDRPQIDIAALMRLRRLVDQQPLSASHDHAASASMLAKGERHEHGKTTNASRGDARPSTTDV
jgi:hypothetical protein